MKSFKYFQDKRHFVNYCRVFAFNLGLSKDLFEEHFSSSFGDLYNWIDKVVKDDIQSLKGLDKIPGKLIEKLKFLNGSQRTNVMMDFFEFHDEEVKPIIYDFERFYKKYKSNGIFTDDKLGNDLNHNLHEFREDFSSLLFYSENDFFAIELYSKGKVPSEEFGNFIKDIEISCGLYFIYDNRKELIYIGKSRDLGMRIRGSIKERTKYYPSYVSVAFTKSVADMHVYEPYYILKMNPLLNVEFREYEGLTLKLPELIITPPVKIFSENLER